MQTTNFLNQTQVKSLNEKQWSVSPQGKYITLYKDDFNDNAWKEVCEQLDVSPVHTDQVDILYFGIQSK